MGRRSSGRSPSFATTATDGFFLSMPATIPYIYFGNHTLCVSTSTTGVISAIHNGIASATSYPGRRSCHTEGRAQAGISCKGEGSQWAKRAATAPRANAPDADRPVHRFVLRVVLSRRGKKCHSIGVVSRSSTDCERGGIADAICGPGGVLPTFYDSVSFSWVSRRRERRYVGSLLGYPVFGMDLCRVGRPGVPVSPAAIE